MAQVSFYKINNSQLNSLAIAEGQIIFVQDTGDLYIDKDSSNRVQIGNDGLNLENGIGEGALQQKNALALADNAFAEGDSGYSTITLSGAANATTYTTNDAISRPYGQLINLANGSIAAIRTYSATTHTVTVNQTLSSTELINQSCIRFTKAAAGDYSHIEGVSTSTMGTAAHAEGSNTTAMGDNSHAEGEYAHAEGECSHAEGRHTNAMGSYSHAEGSSGMADGMVISGDANATTYVVRDEISSYLSVGDIVTTYINDGVYKRITAIDRVNSLIVLDGTLNADEALDEEDIMVYSGGSYGQYSHSEGLITAAYGNYSHSEGEQTKALGLSSHAEGSHTIASGTYQHVQGKYNIDDTNGSYAHIVGNGTGSNARSNAHTIDWSGNAWFKGNIKVGGTDYNSGTSLTPGVIPVNPSDTTNLNIWIQTS